MRAFPAFQTVAPLRERAPFDDRDWLFELKHDGWRSLAFISDGECTLVSRKNNVYKSFAPLRKALANLRVADAVLDGEIVVLDDEGRSLFYELMRRRGEPVFYAFDLLWQDGQDLRPWPLVRRKERLRRIINRSRCPELLFAQHIPTHGTALFKQVQHWDMEGMVCKRKDRPYAPDAGWRKVLNPEYTQREGRHELFNNRFSKLDH